MFFRKLKGFFRGWSPAAVAFLTGHDGPTGSMLGDAEMAITTIDAWRRNVWVRRSVTQIAQTGARMELELYRKSTEKKQYRRVTSHPALELLEKPNNFTSTFDLLFQTFSWLKLRGEAFWILDRPAGAQYPKRALIVDPRDMKEVPSSDHSDILRWMFRLPGGLRVPIDPINVFHVKTPDLANRFRGTSPLESAGLAVASDRAISKHNIGFFSRGMTLGGVLSTDRQLNKATVDDIIKQFEERHRIPHRPAVLHSGLTWTQTQVSPKDADFSGLAQRNREEILSAFGVPPIIAGITDGVNYSTAEQQRKGFWLDVILPMLSLFADEFDRQIVRDPTIVSEFNVDAVEELKMAWDKKLESAGKLFGLGYTTNQINRHLDLGMDDVPWGDTPFLPMGLVPVNDLLASDTGTPQGDQGGNQPADAAASAPNFDRIQNLIERFRVDVVPVVPMESRSPAIAQTRNASSDQLQQILDIMSDDEGRFEKIIARYLRSGMKLGSQQIGYILGITVSFGLDDPLAVAFMSQKALEDQGNLGRYQGSHARPVPEVATGRRRPDRAREGDPV